jgi:cytoskeletal protein CcmA (bactofilin family)
MPSAVGRTMRVKGEMYSDEELYMDGEFEGILEVRHSLTIGPNGKVKANVKAKEVAVMGSIQGNVEAAGRIVIMNGASIIGDVKTAGIVIEDGAFFKGGIDILRTDIQPETAPSTLPTPMKSQGAGA